MTHDKYQFGLNSFGDIAVDGSGNLLSDAASIRQVVSEAIVADKYGVDVIGLGEHHRSEFAISSPEMVLSAIASVTKNIKLSSAVTVLSSDDPVRVFERFSTLDAVSNGRAQIILGRGSFTESFPLFGYELTDYEILFEERLDLFAEIIKEKPVTWSGTTRPSLKDADIFPKSESGKLTAFVGVGGSPQSVIRAARYGFPMMLAIIGGSADRFRPYVELYKQASLEFGNEAYPVGMHSPGFVGVTDKEAIEQAFPLFKTAMDRIGKSRGWQPMSREHFLKEVDQGSMYVGSPETVAKKIARSLKSTDTNRFDLVYGFGPVPVTTRNEMVELYAKEVIPQVKKLLAE